MSASRTRRLLEVLVDRGGPPPVSAAAAGADPREFPRPRPSGDRAPSLAWHAYMDSVTIYAAMLLGAPMDWLPGEQDRLVAALMLRHPRCGHGTHRRAGHHRRGALARIDPTVALEHGVTPGGP